MWEVVGGLLLVIGAFFVLVAAFGLLRLPDVLARMQATSKATTLGLTTIMVAAALHAGTAETTVRVALIILFTFLTAPIGAHVLSRAAYRTAPGGWTGLVVDELGSAGDQAAKMERLAEALPTGETGEARVLVCVRPDEDVTALLAAAGLEHCFERVDVDAHAPRFGAQPHEWTAWVQVTLDTLTTGGHRLVVIGDAAGRPELSPAAQRLVQRSPVPVWFAAGSAAARRGPLLVAMDVPGDARRARPARAALREAAGLAAATGRPLHVVYAWKPPRRGVLLPREATGTDVQADAARARAALADLVGRATLPAPPAALHVEHGHPAEVIPETAARIEASLVIMGTRGRRWGLTARFLPTLAEVVVPRLACDALIVGPGADLEWSAPRTDGRRQAASGARRPGARRTPGDEPGTETPRAGPG
jgi:multicomponent Na+:H+ antiporter subunit G